MNGQTDPLAAMRDIHLPVDPGWWPPAPGWWVLLSAIVAVALLTRPRWRRLRQNRRLIRAFESGLDAIPLDGSAAERSQAMGRMSGIARQYAISRFGRRRVAALSGKDWLDFLDRTSGTSEFSCGAGSLLGEGPYKPLADGPDAESLRLLKSRLIDWARACGREDRGSDA